MTIPDPIADVRDVLLDDAAVSALVGERVYHSEIPETESKNMPRQAVVLAVAGGLGRPKLLKIRHLRLDTICYGASLYESQQIHAAVREALENIVQRTGSVMAVEMLSEGQNGRDPLKQWPVCFASYRLLATTRV